jgi:hypothetical protein
MVVLSKLPTDVVEDILEFMTIPTLVMLAATTRYCRHLVHYHIRGRLIRLITPFFGDVDRFLDILTETRSVISGSQALIFMTPAYQGCWVPNDMDLYTSNIHYWTLLCFLERECGYKTQEGKPGVVRNMGYEEEERIGKYNSVGGIKYVTSLRKGNRKVDIIISDRSASIYPIFFFHTTLVQNFISGKGFFSAYPTLTDKG